MTEQKETTEERGRWAIEFACIADLHLGNHQRFAGVYEGGTNERYRSTLRVMQRVLDRLIEKRVGKLCVLGDVFDTARPSVPEVNGLARLLRRYPGITMQMLVGNHDLYAGDDHALVLLDLLENVLVSARGALLAWDPDARSPRYHIPFIHGDTQAGLRQLLPEVVARACGSRSPIRPGVLLMHAGIADDSTPSYLASAADSIRVDTLAALMREHGIAHCYAGNWHNHRHWKIGEQSIVQCGAICPTGFDNPGSAYGKIVYHHSDGSFSTETIPGPRFYTTAYEDLSDTSLIEEFVAEGDELYLSLTAQPKYLSEARAHVRKLVDDGVIKAGDVRPDRAATSAVARSAARAAVNAKTIDEAVAAYVQKVALPDGADRAEVLALVRRYLAR